MHAILLLVCNAFMTYLKRRGQVTPLLELFFRQSSPLSDNFRPTLICALIGSRALSGFAFLSSLHPKNWNGWNRATSPILSLEQTRDRSELTKLPRARRLGLPTCSWPLEEGVLREGAEDAA